MPNVTRDGVRLHWSERGGGPCVLWHTGGGGDGTMWQRAGYLDALPGRRHLLYDHRGHGQSDQPEGIEAHRLDQYVDDVVAVMDAAEVARATVIGYSAGARVLFNLAARHPARVEAVVGIGGVTNPTETSEGRGGLAREVRAIGFRRWLEQMSESETEPPPAWLMDNLASTPTEMFALEVEAWENEPPEYECFPSISAPTLIICGELENTDGAAELAVELLSNGAYRILPGLGHLQAFWHVELTAPVIAEFLASQ